MPGKASPAQFAAKYHFFHRDEGGLYGVGRDGDFAFVVGGICRRGRDVIGGIEQLPCARRREIICAKTLFIFRKLCYNRIKRGGRYATK